MANYATERPLVLVVEDEYLIRTDTAETIRDAGFEVIEASNADEAIILLESRQDIWVVFTDIQMPGSMDRLKLAQAVRHRWPPVHIVATSGRRVLQASELPAGSLFFPKPYSPHKIASTLRTLTQNMR